MHFRVHQTLAASRSAVFDVISDPRRRLEWQSSLRDLQMETPGAPRVGTRWQEHTQGGIRFDMEITDYDPPVRWAERARGRLANAELRVEFHEVGSGTLVDVDVTIDFKGPFRLLSPLVQQLMPGALSKDLRRAGELARLAPPPPG